MPVLDQIKNYIATLNTQELQRMFLIVIGVFVFLLCGFLFYHIRSVNALHRDINSVNKTRREVQHMLSTYATVQEQKESVNKILTEDKAFKIKEYFTSVLRDLQFEQKNIEQTTVSEPRDLRNGYFEIRLDGSFINITMQNLAELLQTIERNKRVYIKDLTITKNTQTPTIDARLSIATLQPKPETQ
jgi:hypothetical protein